jgi:hypothetical protein
MNTTEFINCNATPETPFWFEGNEQKNPIISHTPGGRIDPSKIQMVSVHRQAEVLLNPSLFLARAQAIPGAANACAFDFFQKPENQHYLGIGRTSTVLVFPNTLFARQIIRTLTFNGHWHRTVLLGSIPFGHLYKVAVFPPT